MLNFRNLFRHKWNRVLIFNISRKGLAALEADFNFADKKIRLRNDFEFLAPAGEAFSMGDALIDLEKITQATSRNTSLIFLFEKPFLKSTLSVFSIIREKPLELIDEEELENVILNLAWRLYDRERPIVSRVLGVSEFDLVLTSSKIKDPRIDGRKILNPIGFAGRRLGFTFENTYSQKDFWEKLMKIPRRFKGEANFLVEDNLVFDKVFSLLDEQGILVEIGPEETRVGQLGNFLKNSESFNWGEENITKLIAKSFSVPLEAARELKERYQAGNLSGHSLHYLEKILLNELKILIDGVSLAIKNFTVEDTKGWNLYLSGPLVGFPRLLECFRSHPWSRTILKRRPVIGPYQKERIFDKINVAVEGLENLTCSDSLALTVAMAELFLPESPYQELNKILKRRIKWLK
ncbi:MAG TPA: hypothetical protein P5524_01470 [Candidatus Paceibacterota bacterium]|nr:hypothetical protein [Candidatus Paceibacterota bacterium]